MSAIHLSPSIEWDSDHASPHCILCGTAWGTFRNRRHHCRSCGRLVCESCSSNKFKLDATHHRGSISDNSAISAGVPQRVCDTCYVILVKKREVKLQVVKAKDKNVEILLSTSYVSASLINVYYVDGTSQTFSVDESMTVKDLSALVAKDFAMSTTTGFTLTLFQVTQDLNDPKVGGLAVTIYSIQMHALYAMHTVSCMLVVQCSHSMVCDNLHRSINLTLSIMQLLCRELYVPSVYTYLISIHSNTPCCDR